MQSPGVAEFAELLTEKGATMIIGAGVPYELGYPLGYELASALAQDFDVQTGDLGSVVKAIIDRGIKREEIAKRIREIFAEKSKEASKIDPLSNPYFLLSKILKSLVMSWKSRGFHLTINIITANFDRELESVLGKEFERGPSGYSVIVSKDDYSKPTDAYVKVYKVHGDIYAEDDSGRDLMVLTEDDLRSSERYRKALYSSMKGAVVGVPLLVMGYSFRDKDVQVVYEEAKEALGNIPTFDVHPGGEQNIGEAVTIPETSSESLKELIDYLSGNREFRDLSAYTDYGVELSVDEELKKAVEKAKKEGAPAVLYGHRYSGKTLAVLRARRRGIIPEEYFHVELPKYPMGEDYVEGIKDRLKGRAIIEGSSYQVQFLTGKERKGWLSRLFGKDEERKKGWIPEGSVLVESKITPDDAERLFNYFFELIADKHRGEAGYRREELEGKRDHLLELASWGGSPSKGSGLLIPSLLKKAIEDYAGKNEEELEKLKNIERDREKLLIESFGLSLPEAIGVASEFGELIGDLKRTVLPFVSKILIPSAIALLGISSIVNFYEEKKDSGLGKYVQLHKAWNEYPLEKREILCEKLDEKYGLNPGDSYSFLSSWLSPRETEGEYDDFKSKLEEVFTEDFIKKLNEAIKKVPELESEVRGIKERINYIIDEMNRLEEEFRRLTAASPLLEVEDDEQLRGELGIKFAVEEGVHDKKFNEMKEHVRKVLENPQDEEVPNIIIITGESGTGKTTLSYRVLSYFLKLRESGYLKGLKIYEVDKPDTGYTGDSRAIYFIDDAHYREEEWYKILEINSRIRNKSNGPVIVSVVDFRYKKMKRKLEQDYESNSVDEENIKKRIKDFEISEANDEELAIIFDSLLEDLEKSENLEAEKILEIKKVRNKVIEKAKGIPVIILFFFDQLKNVILDEESINKAVDNMGADPEGYAARRLIDSYLNHLMDNDEKLRYMLALLDALSAGDLYVTVLDRPKDNNGLTGAINELWGLGYLNNYDVKLPLFDVDIEGVVHPIHLSVQFAVDKILERLKDLNASGIKSIDNFVSRVQRQLDFIELTDEVYEVRTYAQNSYREHFNKVIDKRPLFVSPIYAIPAFYTLNDEEKEEYINEFLSYLSKRFSINKTVSPLFEYMSYRFFKDCIYDTALITEQSSLKELSIKLLNLNNGSVRSDAWRYVRVLIENGIITKDDKRYFLELLKSSNESIRSYAWRYAEGLIEHDIITKDDAISLKLYFLELLKSSNESIRSDAWGYVKEFIENGIITKDDIRS